MIGQLPITTYSFILGWFHSHPTFAPEPSQQDLDTQRSVQQWIGHNKPCIGIILSPFSMNGALIASPFRCMIVERHPDILDRFVPYRFEVDVVTNGFNVKGFLEDIERILGEDNEERRIDFRKNYFLDVSITYLDKVRTFCMHRFLVKNVVLVHIQRPNAYREMRDYRQCHL